MCLDFCFLFHGVSDRSASLYSFSVCCFLLLVTSSSRNILPFSSILSVSKGISHTFISIVLVSSSHVVLNCKADTQRYFFPCLLCLSVDSVFQTHYVWLGLPTSPIFNFLLSSGILGKSVVIHSFLFSCLSFPITSPYASEVPVFIFAQLP